MIFAFIKLNAIKKQNFKQNQLENALLASHHQTDTLWDKVFKNGPSEICGRQPLKNLKGYGLLKADHNPSIFIEPVSQKFY